MGTNPHYLGDLIGWCITACVSLVLFVLARRITSERLRRIAIAGLAASILWISLGTALKANRIATHFPTAFVIWVRASGIALAAMLSYFLCLSLAVRLFPPFRPSRRRAMQVAVGAIAAAPAVVAAFSIIRRSDLFLREVSLEIPNLHPDLQGVTIVQLSDIHLGAFVDESLLARAVDMANETRARIAIVTGDLISYKSDPLDRCLDQVARLRSDAGTFGCHGNHEIYTRTEEYTTEQGARRGITYLRDEARVLQFGKARLNLAGVDYQQRRKPYLVKAPSLMAPDALNILLSHNPDVFPVAARQGYDVTLSGHTHGGQVKVEILGQYLTPARFLTPYIYGTYYQKSSALYVTSGIGTIGVPARLGSPAEVALIRLCAT